MSTTENDTPPPEPLKRSMRLVRPYEPKDARCMALMGQAVELARDLGADLLIGDMANRRGEVNRGWSYVVAAASDGKLEEYGVFGYYWENLLPCLINSLEHRKAERCGLERCGLERCGA